MLKKICQKLVLMSVFSCFGLAAFANAETTTVINNTPPVGAAISPATKDHNNMMVIDNKQSFEERYKMIEESEMKDCAAMEVLKSDLEKDMHGAVDNKKEELQKIHDKLKKMHEMHCAK